MIYFLASLIGISMLTEFAHVFLSIFQTIKEKCRKKTDEEKEQIKTEEKKTHDQKMNEYWRNSKVIQISSSLAGASVKIS
jgi:hypothetical protein